MKKEKTGCKGRNPREETERKNGVFQRKMENKVRDLRLGMIVGIKKGNRGF